MLSRSAVRAAGSIAALCLLVTVLFLAMSRWTSIYDEGLILTGAARVAAGDYPHRDFYANYGPGTFVLLAVLFKAAGPSIVVERLFDLVIRALIVLTVHATLRRVASQKAAWAATVIAGVYLLAIGFHGYPVFPGLLLALWSLLLFCGDAGSESAGRPLAAGVLCALVGWFRYDVGAMTYLALMAGALAAAWLGRRSSGLAPSAMGRRMLRFSGGAALPTLGLLAVHGWYGALPGLWHDIVQFPSSGYAAYRSLPFPGLEVLWSPGFIDVIGIFLPLVTVPVGVIYLAILARVGPGRTRDPGDETDARRPTQVLMLSCLVGLTAMFYAKGAVRVSLEHLMLSIVPSLMLLALLTSLARQRVRWVRWAAGLGLGLHLLGAAALADKHLDRAPLVVDHLEPVRDVLSGARTLDAEGWGRRFDRAMFISVASRTAALEYLRARVRPGEPFFSGVGRHDKIVINDVSIYFELGVRPATRWHHFDPGLQISRRVQSEMVSELSAARPRYLFIDRRWDRMREPNLSAQSSGVLVLDEYIRSHYEEDAAFGPILILKAREAR